MVKKKAIIEEALRRRAERRKLQPLEYGQEEDDIEVIIAQEMGPGSPNAKANATANPAEPPTPLMDFDVGEDYYGEQQDDLESPDGKSKKTGAKYRKSKSKKKEKATINQDDSTVAPLAEKKTTVIKKKQPT